MISLKSNTPFAGSRRLRNQQVIYVFWWMIPSTLWRLQRCLGRWAGNKESSAKVVTSDVKIESTLQTEKRVLTDQHVITSTYQTFDMWICVGYSGGVALRTFVETHPFELRQGRSSILFYIFTFYIQYSVLYEVLVALGSRGSQWFKMRLHDTELV